MNTSGPTQMIVLNGGSSAGKSEISRALQVLLGHPWLRLSIDDLVDRLPPPLSDEAGIGIAFGHGGEVAIGERFRTLEAAWMAGAAAMAGKGAGIVFDDVFLEGAASQERTRQQLEGLHVLWVGVRCDLATAAAREVARKDRPTGMAAAQAEVVHAGVTYDVEVDTTHATSLDCARVIAGSVRRQRT